MEINSPLRRALIFNIMIGIYKITSPSGKVYIGQSWEIETRFYNYSRDLARTQGKLHNSFIKYGIEKHTFEIIHELTIESTQESMDYFEIHYMKFFKEQGFDLLNIREGGSRGKNSPETIEKMRKSKSLEHKLKIGKANSGKVRSPEAAERNRNLRKGLVPASAKKVINIITKEVYPSARAAAETLTVSHSMLKHMLNGSRINKTNLQYEDRYNNSRN
jgi:group I intron endonuclease